MTRGPIRSVVLMVLIAAVVFSCSARTHSFAAPACSAYGPGLGGMVFSPDGSKAYITFGLSDRLMVIDPGSMSVSSCIDVSAPGDGILKASAQEDGAPGGVAAPNY